MKFAALSLCLLTIFNVVALLPQPASALRVSNYFAIFRCISHNHLRATNMNVAMLSLRGRSAFIIRVSMILLSCKSVLINSV